MTEAPKHFSIMVKEYGGKEFELCKVGSHPWDIVRALGDKTPRYKTIEVRDRNGEKQHWPIKLRLKSLRS